MSTVSTGAGRSAHWEKVTNPTNPKAPSVSREAEEEAGGRHNCLSQLSRAHVAKKKSPRRMSVIELGGKTGLSGSQVQLLIWCFPPWQKRN
jgi:hypothetical protein